MLFRSGPNGYMAYGPLAQSSMWPFRMAHSCMNIGPLAHSSMNITSIKTITIQSNKQATQQKISHEKYHTNELVHHSIRNYKQQLEKIQKEVVPS